MYCVRCKQKTLDHSEKIETTKNNRTMKKAVCGVCGCKKCQFVNGSGFVNNMINKLPFEMHLPGHNFTGPGTRLAKRLKSDGTPQDWSKPINRIDSAAYKHDLCYRDNPSTETRNSKCDKGMLKEMGSIYNPTIRERMERGLVSKIIGAKQKFGMGTKKILDE